jgi:hypothetical protein
MSVLATTAILLGITIVLLHAPCVLSPNTMRECMKRFPRSKPAAWFLTAVDLVWSVWLLHNIDFGSFEQFKPLLYVLTPVVFFLMVFFMDELLAPRALGGLFLLVPAPLLTVARWHKSEMRLVIVLLAYALVIAGTILVLSPYQFRKLNALWIDNDKLCRTVGAIGVVFGMFVVVLGITVF